MILLAALMAVSRLWEVGSLSRVVRKGNDDMIMRLCIDASVDVVYNQQYLISCGYQRVDSRQQL